MDDNESGDAFDDFYGVGAVDKHETSKGSPLDDSFSMQDTEANMSGNVVEQQAHTNAESDTGKKEGGTTSTFNLLDLVTEDHIEVCTCNQKHNHADS